MKQQKPEGIKLTSVIVNTIILASMIVALTSGMKLI
jgi:hypothetical protein